MRTGRHTLMNFAVKELSKTSGFIKVANDIDEVFDVANEGITALIDNVGMAGVDVIGQINELQRVLDASSGFLSLIGGRAANDLSRTPRRQGLWIVPNGMPSINLAP